MNAQYVKISYTYKNTGEMTKTNGAIWFTKICKINQFKKHSKECITYKNKLDVYICICLCVYVYILPNKFLLWNLIHTYYKEDAKYYGLQPSVMHLHAEQLQVSHSNKGIPGMVQLLF
jgi:hypothetical protein